MQLGVSLLATIWNYTEKDMFGPRHGSLEPLWLDSCKRLLPVVNYNRTTLYFGRPLAGSLTVFFNRSKFLAIAN